MKLKGHNFIQTEDGSYTAFSERYNEACHSTSGAVTETKLHYIEGCNIIEKALSHSPLAIFEVGFGVGVGFFETQKALAHHHFHFLSIEIDEALVKYVFETNELLKSYKIKNEDNLIIYEVKTQNFHLEVLVGDARVTVSEYLKKNSFTAHAIYQDAFSPKRNPDLWTIEWFTLLKSFSDKDVIMSTYSSSSAIRKSMLMAGFKLYAGEKFGPKRSSTRARLTGETSEAILEHLKRSEAITLTDANKHTYKLEGK